MSEGHYDNFLSQAVLEAIGVDEGISITASCERCLDTFSTGFYVI